MCGLRMPLRNNHKHSRRCVSDNYHDFDEYLYHYGRKYYHDFDQYLYHYGRKYDHDVDNFYHNYCVDRIRSFGVLNKRGTSVRWLL